jgi:hypothetical protein
MNSDHLIDQLAGFFGMASAQDIDTFLDSLAHSGLDLSTMSLEDLQDLFEHTTGSHHVPDTASPPASSTAAHAGERFAGGRWEGVGKWGEPVEQSSLGPPTNANTGAKVDPNDVTWDK